MIDRKTAGNSGFASGELIPKLVPRSGQAVQTWSFVFRTPPERKAQNRYF
jgi:hypothetical protein